VTQNVKFATKRFRDATSNHPVPRFCPHASFPGYPHATFDFHHPPPIRFHTRRHEPPLATVDADLVAPAATSRRLTAVRHKRTAPPWGWRAGPVQAACDAAPLLPSVSFVCPLPSPASDHESFPPFTAARARVCLLSSLQVSSDSEDEEVPKWKRVQRWKSLNKWQRHAVRQIVE